MITISSVRTAEEKAAYFGVRHTVFVKGQNVPADIEVDDYDANPRTWHVLASLNNEPVGAVRVVLWKPNEAKIGRLAVLDSARGKGIGKMLIETVLDDMPGHGVTKAVMSAQAYLQRFYEDLGFHVVGERYEEAGIEHVWMEKDLKETAAA